MYAVKRAPVSAATHNTAYISSFQHCYFSLENGYSVHLRNVNIYVPVCSALAPRTTTTTPSFRFGTQLAELMEAMNISSQNNWSGRDMNRVSHKYERTCYQELTSCSFRTAWKQAYSAICRNSYLPTAALLDVKHRPG